MCMWNIYSICQDVTAATISETKEHEARLVWLVYSTEKPGLKNKTSISHRTEML